MMELFDIGDRVIAKTYIAPAGTDTIAPGMTGVIAERDEVIRRHKVRFDSGRELWANSDQIELTPELKKQKEEAAAKAAAEKTAAVQAAKEKAAKEKEAKKNAEKETPAKKKSGGKTGDK